MLKFFLVVFFIFESTVVFCESTDIYKAHVESEIKLDSCKTKLELLPSISPGIYSSLANKFKIIKEKEEKIYPGVTNAKSSDIQDHISVSSNPAKGVDEAWWEISTHLKTCEAQLELVKNWSPSTFATLEKEYVKFKEEKDAKDKAYAKSQEATPAPWISGEEFNKKLQICEAQLKIFQDRSPEVYNSLSREFPRIKEQIEKQLSPSDNSIPAQSTVSK